MESLDRIKVLSDRLEWAKEGYLQGDWKKDVRKAYGESKDRQTLIGNTKELILVGPKLPDVPKDCVLMNNGLTQASALAMLPNAKIISGADKALKEGEYILADIFGEVLILVAIGELASRLEALPLFPDKDIDLNQFPGGNMIALVYGLREVEGLRQLIYTDAQFFSYFALFTLTDYFSNLSKSVIKRADAESKSGNYIAALESSLENATLLTEAQDAMQASIAQAYTDALNTSKEAAQELNKELSKTQKEKVENEIKIEAKKDIQIGEFRTRSATLKSLKSEAQDIVRIALDNDADKVLRTTSLAKAVFSELETRHPEGERSQYFPKISAVKGWVREATDGDHYTKKKGAPEKKQ